MSQKNLKIKEKFHRLGANLLSELKQDEHLNLVFLAEETEYTRYNHSKVRQTSFVDQATIDMSLIINERNLDITLNFNSKDEEKNLKKFIAALKASRKESLLLPRSNTLVLPSEVSESINQENLGGEMPEDIHESILSPVEGEDLVGLLVSGSVSKGFLNSANTSHWFRSRSFYLDYSLYSKQQKAVKACFAGSNWNQTKYQKNISQSLDDLKKLSLTTQEIPPGKYRTYLAPEAIAEIVNLMSWGAMSGKVYKLGLCGMKKAYEGEVELSKKFSLKEDFNLGFSPRFNFYGEVCPKEISLIDQGNFKNLLVSTATANEYKDLETNFAEPSEELKTPHISGGSIEQDDILNQLKTGLYVSHIHYLNWSEPAEARVTGVTRFSCFWVENGKIKGPTKHLRFDESLFNIFGKNLVGLTKETKIIPTVSTYENRSIGCSSIPGVIVDDFSYNL